MSHLDKDFAQTLTFGFASLEDAFPNIDPGVRVLGDNVLVQFRRVKSKSSGGIILTHDSYARATEDDNTIVAKVVQLGPLAFRHPKDLTLWPEGAWYEIGDFVRAPKHGGDRWTMDFAKGGPDEKVKFGQFQCRFIQAVITSDPLKMRAYIG